MQCAWSSAASVWTIHGSMGKEQRDEKDELMSKEQLFYGLCQILRKFPKETDMVLCHFCFKPKKVTNEALSVDHAEKSQVLVSSFILLKTTLDGLPLLSKSFTDEKWKNIRGREA
ncbi:DNA mismatch repair protein MSH4-like isoform X2 [Arachis stenosperma]|uniref:DNA mismatch repair protein MSH4-like isoform X2 n=1 Tax=Arachis stenosperma TaxID=217475 RepID=UPI0025AD7643|nr:DNA mismatch repair protein MSH4-like isoform X2 [Arachis stenosperma]